MRYAARIALALDRFWFVPGTATRLAVLRIAIGMASLLYFGDRFAYFSRIAESSPTVFEPVGLARVLSGPIPVPMFQILMAFMLIANVGFILGWRFNRTGPLFAALLIWVLCYRNSWSMIYHTDNVLVLHVLVLGLTRSADALSLDAVRGWSISGALGRLRGYVPGAAERTARAGSISESRGAVAETAPTGPAPARPSWHWEYGYPIRLMIALTAIVYVLSGIAKVTGDHGWAWALGDGVRTQIAFDGLRKELIDQGAKPLTWVIYNSPLLATFIGVGTLILEFGAPLALVNDRLAKLFAVALYSMHWGIYAIMGIIFWYQLSGLAFLPFVVDERVVAWGRARVRSLASFLAGAPPAAREPLRGPGPAVAAYHPSEAALPGPR